MDINIPKNPGDLPSWRELALSVKVLKKQYPPDATLDLLSDLLDENALLGVPFEMVMDTIPFVLEETDADEVARKKLRDFLQKLQDRRMLRRRVMEEKRIETREIIETQFGNKIFPEDPKGKKNPSLDLKEFLRNLMVDQRHPNSNEAETEDLLFHKLTQKLGKNIDSLPAQYDEKIDNARDELLRKSINLLFQRYSEFLPRHTGNLPGWDPSTLRRDQISKLVRAIGIEIQEYVSKRFVTSPKNPLLIQKIKNLEAINDDLTKVLELIAVLDMVLDTIN